ncbi:endonuclease domain-containing protein [Mesonia sp. MT50]|uniref:Endonuclease domain-containing protein n=1 Tax=Mesonia profundi TaxID=3070998 RepID=A0ABU1A3K4_9FLAO|nr:endonuclease domain-containing protein [Mesonia profundi]MDQ7918267.1 endonuclease domain-containing protein [Mesonia profundi]
MHWFIVDFYCHHLKLVIEVDGAYHNNKKQIIRDRKRTQLLESQDLTIIRFTNNQVLNSIQTVLKRNKKQYENNLQQHPPLGGHRGANEYEIIPKQHPSSGEARG